MLEYDVRLDSVREPAGRSRARIITLVKISAKISNTVPPLYGFKYYNSKGVATIYTS